MKRSFNQVYKVGKLEMLSHCLVVHGHRQANYHHELFGKFFIAEPFLFFIHVWVNHPSLLSSTLNTFLRTNKCWGNDVIITGGF